MFKRRTADPADATSATDPELDTATGKGRATPTRKEAEAARLARAKPPKTRREAMALERRRKQESRAKTNGGLTSGDERYLPERDKGPVRRFIRDFVDSRRTLAEYFLPIAVLLFALSLAPRQVASWAFLIWYVVILLMAVDSYLLVRRMKKQLRQRFPDQPTKGTTSYALLRSFQLRRLRLPKPQVKPGAVI